jgi:kynureninase
MLSQALPLVPPPILSSGPAPARPLTRRDCQALDAADPLAGLRDLFVCPATATAPAVIYLDGNSLGALPRATPARLAQVVADEWGEGLIRSWNDAGWISLAQRVGDKIARLVGAGPGEVVVADSTSVNLYKVLSAALGLQAGAHPGKRVILSERGNFPTDLYIAQSLARQNRLELRLVPPERIEAELDERVAVLMLTHVDYRSGRVHDMAALTARAHAAGALAVWDLAHSAGALPVDLRRADADFAVGCGYKYLNGGPGAPAFVWMHPRHAQHATQPLAGWLGHAAPFAFDPDYTPAPGIQRFVCGTPPILSLAALECGVDTVLAVEPLGGLQALRHKSLALSRLFIDLVDAHCAAHGVWLASPGEDARRGSQVSLGFDGPAPGAGSGAFGLMQALIARGVIGDFRAGLAPAGQPADGVAYAADAGNGSRNGSPNGGGAGSGAEPHAASADLLRFGFTPLYTRFVDVWDAVAQLRQVLDSGEWREARFQQRGGVT